jgi:hypothetical protein
VLRGHQPVEMEAFNGLWARGDDDAVPPDHFSDILNMMFTPEGIQTRDGFGDASLVITSVRRAWVYKVYGQADRLLILDGSGNLWDSTNLVTPILTIAEMTDCAFLNFAGRAYISPNDGNTGLPGEKVYIYKGSGVAVAAGGVVPTGSMVAAESASAGDIEAGLHLFAVAYETDTGFITAPGPAVFASVTATGGLSVDLSGIPIGPSNTAARRIIATKIIQNYNGDQTGYEFFFVPDGRIANNSATTLTVSFFDVALLSSADYLFDLFTEIPALLWLNTFGGRLVGGGENANPSVVRISEPGQPEAINQITGLLVIDPANTSSPVTNGQEIREVLYLFKKSRAYATSDNNAEPSSWKVTNIDEGTGTYPHGIAAVADSGGVNIDKAFIADQSGLMQFTGTFARPELSWKIRDVWARINKLYFHTVNIAHDTNIQRIYVAVPLDAATHPSHILVGDYSNYDGSYNASLMSAMKWTIWTLADNKQPQVVLVETNTSDNTLVFRVGVYGGNFYNLVADRTNDFQNAIPTPYLQTGIIPKAPSGEILHINALRYKIKGYGALVTTLYDRDKVTSSVAAGHTLAANPGKEVTVLANFKAQGFIVKLSVSSLNEYFKLHGLKIFVKQFATSFPG